MKKKKDQIKNLYESGLNHLKQDKLLDSKEIFLQIIKLDKYNSNSYSNIGLIEKKLNNLKKSITYYKKAITINRKNYIAYNNLANIYKEIKNYKKGKDFYLKSIKIKPNYLEATMNLALLYEEIGDFKNSIKYYRKALKLKGNKFEIYLKLSQLDESVLDFDLEKKIDYSINKNDLKLEYIVPAYYLKSKYYFKKKDYQNELKFLLKAHNSYFNLEKKKFIPNLKYWFEFLPNFSNLNFEKSTYSNKNISKGFKPIFIIGLPRSGSTMLEKILISGKTNIVSGEETGIINNIVKKKLISDGSINIQNRTLYSEIINSYIDRNMINKKKDVFTDKSLENFFFINLIFFIFPNAKIIHCKRNIFSCLVSIIKNNLKDLPWAHQIKHINQYINIYSKVIKFYKTKFPNLIYDVDLENITKNPKVELEKIFNYCELPWDIKCLKFYKRKNITSKTASNIQIRKPINTNDQKYSVYKNYLNNIEKKTKIS